jgi:hypothetical protein
MLCCDCAVCCYSVVAILSPAAVSLSLLHMSAMIALFVDSHMPLPPSLVSVWCMVHSVWYAVWCIACGMVHGA